MNIGDFVTRKGHDVHMVECRYPEDDSVDLRCVSPGSGFEHHQRSHTAAAQCRKLTVLGRDPPAWPDPLIAFCHPGGVYVRLP